MEMRVMACCADTQFGGSKGLHDPTCFEAYWVHNHVGHVS
jgi:hypothetical protein